MKRSGKIHWPLLAFLIGFTLLMIAVSYYTLIPGMQAATQPGITDEEKRRLVAWYRLLLTVVLFILFAGLVLTFRFGRFFFPRPTPPRTKTEYLDAWTESAKRLHVPPADDQEP